MTVTSQVYRIERPGDGAVFAFSFTTMEIFALTELLVLTVDANGVATQRLEGTGSAAYSVAMTTDLNDGKSGGVITYPEDEGVALLATESIIIIRHTPLTQLTEFGRLGSTLPAKVEVALDKMVMKVHTLREKIDRIHKLRQTNLTADPALPLPVAGESFRWNEDADALEGVALVSGGSNTASLLTDMVDGPISYVGFAGSYYKVNAGEDALEYGDPGAPAQVIHVKDVKSGGTNGGSSVTGSWLARVLNTESANTLTGASLAANQITLPAGTYKVMAWQCFYRAGNSCQTRLRDTTNDVTLALGVKVRASSTSSVGGSQMHFPIIGIFTLSGTAVIELQYQCAAVTATNGLGINNDTGDDNTFAEVMINRVVAI